MALLLNPPPGAPSVYPFVLAQDFFYQKLIEHRDSVLTVFPAFDYEVTKNKGETYISDNDNNGLVNILIAEADSQNATNVGKDHAVQLNFELYWREQDDVTGNHADELAIEYLYYLAQNVEFTLNALQNENVDTLPYGSYRIGQMRTDFAAPQKIGQSSKVWGLGKIILDIITSYNYNQLVPPNLQTVSAGTGTLQGIYPANPV